MEFAPLQPLEPLNEAGPEMPAAPKHAALGAAKVSLGATTGTGPMDRDFIARNQIVERYLSGKLPVKGATDFERFCRDHPQLLDELGLPERVNAGVRLLEASGKPEPWQEARQSVWQNPYTGVALCAALLITLIILAVVASRGAEKNRQIAELQKTVIQQPIEPATSTHSIRLLPSRTGASESPAVVIGANDRVELADLRIDMVRSAFRAFRVTIDRVGQGRVAVLHNLVKDSNGHLRIALNSSALGPGNYQFTIEGLTWQGEVVPDAWVTIGVAQ